MIIGLQNVHVHKESVLQLLQMAIQESELSYYYYYY